MIYSNIPDIFHDIFSNKIREKKKLELLRHIISYQCIKKVWHSRTILWMKSQIQRTHEGIPCTVVITILSRGRRGIYLFAEMIPGIFADTSLAFPGRIIQPYVIYYVIIDDSTGLWVDFIPSFLTHTFWGLQAFYRAREWRALRANAIYWFREGGPPTCWGPPPSGYALLVEVRVRWGTSESIKNFKIN